MSAQSVVDGYVTLMLDHLPHAREAVEVRARVFAERDVIVGEHVTLHLSGYADGLVADRDGRTTGAIVRPLDLYADLRHRRFDVRVGLTRVVWGRLDELQPSDVINPLDVSRFLFEGRSEARLPVALVRTRLFLPRESTLEAIVVPVFRSGRFDQLDEPSSPFNLVAEAAQVAPTLRLPVVRREPDVAWRNLQGGLRLSATTKRVDWAVTAFRGFETFPLYELVLPRIPPTTQPIGRPITAALVALHEIFPRITMIGADFETVRGVWGLRGELAAFVDDNFQARSELAERAADAARVVGGRSFEAGVGADRKAGEYRIAGNLLVHRRQPRGAAAETDVSLVAAAERSFTRETRVLKLFGVYNIDDRTSFVRHVAAASVHDNVWLEGSVGWFFGRGTSVFGRFADRDFVYARLKVYF